jgi:hypothetical protein
MTQVGRLPLAALLFNEKSRTFYARFLRFLSETLTQAMVKTVRLLLAALLFILTEVI